ncbi:proton-conducting transporter transmembrane domain-containing protein [Streptomyces alkaliterrae]|uniref:proton-conducting transporter transmembrane domain-containing protein n=1 Tax=Streptomyces alkaliterrae TaxID=2213162 RepID=UPI0034DD82D8
MYAEQPGWSLTLTVVGLVTAVLGALQALREHDLKALLAYSQKTKSSTMSPARTRPSMAAPNAVSCA